MRVAVAPHRAQQGQQAGGRVEADGVADLRRLGRRVGEHEGDAHVGARQLTQTREPRGQAGDALDPLGMRRVEAGRILRRDP